VEQIKYNAINITLSCVGEKDCVVLYVYPDNKAVIISPLQVAEEFREDCNFHVGVG